MSKKLAEGSNALVLDVKCGRGAFMKDVSGARALAQSMVAIGTHAGVRTEALISRMDAPLGRAVGNALEVIECIEILKGRGPRELADFVVTFAARMLVVAGQSDEDHAEATVRRVLESGAAIEKLRALISAQGGDPLVVDDYSRLPAARHRRTVASPRGGYVAYLDAEGVGRASAALGAGRVRVDDRIDHGAGVLIHRMPGDAVRAGDPVLELLYNDERGLDEAIGLASGALGVADAPPPMRSLVLDSVRSAS
jgi:thymidine phosphorylase